MEKERTIILAVVGADIQYAKQVIIRRCKDVDPTGKRTLGVITKPDMTPDEYINQEFLDLANNKDERNQMLLGWYVLRNSAKEERNSAEERDEAKRAFFASSRWGTEVSTDNLGIDALRRKISTQIIRHVAREIGHVEVEIEALLTQCRKKLEEIGYGWNTTQKMRDALSKFCTRSRDLTNLAVRGDYDNPIRENFFPPYAGGDGLDLRRLRACVVSENLQFSEVMENYGTECVIGDGPLNNEPIVLNNLSAKYGIVVKSTPRDRFIDEHVKPLISFGRGTEQLVDHNPKLVFSLFQTYSSNWPKVADKHVRVIQMLCEKFLEQMVQYAWPPGNQARVWYGIVKKQLDARLQSAHEVLQELKDHRFRLVQTYHSKYRTKYHQLRSADNAEGEQTKHEDMLDKMLLHYKHQLPTFINNVIMQVIERKLVHGMGEIFDFMHNLTDLEVERLMEDDSETEAKRRLLKDELETLERGLKICEKIARRPGVRLRESQSYRYTAAAGPAPVANPPAPGQHIPSRPYPTTTQTTTPTHDPHFNRSTLNGHPFNPGSSSSPFTSRTRPTWPGSAKVATAQSSSNNVTEDDEPRWRAQQAELHTENVDFTSSKQVYADVDARDLSEMEGTSVGDAEIARERRKKKGKKKFVREADD